MIGDNESFNSTTPPPSLVEDIPVSYVSFLVPPTYTSRENSIGIAPKSEKDISVFRLPSAERAPVIDTLAEIPTFSINDMNGVVFNPVDPSPVRHQSVAVAEKTTIQHLAMSADELRELMNEAKAELKMLLLLLGYKDIERLTETLIANLGTIEKIKHYLATLLQSMIQQDLSQARLQVYTMVHLRCHRFGQSVVRLLSNGTGQPQTTQV